MREICMSGLTSGDWKRSNGPRLRHRQKANAAGKQLILATDCHRASRRTLLSVIAPISASCSEVYAFFGSDSKRAGRRLRSSGVRRFMISFPVGPFLSGPLFGPPVDLPITEQPGSKSNSCHARMTRSVD